MKKATIIKITITLGAILLLVIGFHLIGSALFPMIKHHLGM